MLKKYSNEISTFMSYFKEADGDDKVSVTVAPRQNRGTDYSDNTTNVNVPPRANRGTDYSADTTDDTAPDTNDAPQEQNTTDTEDNTPTDNDEGTDYTDNDNPDTDNADEGNEADDTTAQDEGGEDEAQEEDPAEPDTGDGGTDYSSDDGNTGEEDTDNQGGENSEETDEDRDEQLKKYHMYTRFVHLYNILNSMLEKCRDVVKPDAIQNAVIKKVTNNLSEVYDNMFDFMTIKYKSSTYVQILFYYETVISIVQLNFELLRNNHINLKQ